MSERRWLEVRVGYDGADPRVDLVADALVVLGARGVEERGPDFLAWFEEPASAEDFVAAASGELARVTGLTDLRVDYRWQAHEAWAESWKRGLRPRRVTDRLVVHPSWSRPTSLRPEDLAIVIDPGLAFGTAEHATTRGCLRLLDGAVDAGDSILDIGAGSGILSIACARLGAHRITAMESDALACEALRENVARNGVGAFVEVREMVATVKDLASFGPFDGLVVNIEYGLMEPLFGAFPALLAADGWLVVSGTLVPQWSAASMELEALGFRERRTDSEEGWCSGLFDLQAAPS